ncbi:MAG: RHS repeat domain-containing protein [Idiomarina sp.]
MSKLTKLLGAAAAVLTLYSGLSYAQSASTDYTYDARGRLIKVDNASGEVNYNYDDAGNRTSVSATNTAPTGTPTIDVFGTPAMVNSGEVFSVFWQSSNATACEISVSAANGTSFMMAMSSPTIYQSLSPDGGRLLQITEKSNVTLTCTNGTESVSVNRVIDINSGPVIIW